VVAVSAKAESGLAPLQPQLRYGRTVALLGPSGVGKSSIVNRLVGSEVLATGEVRDWDKRGRHTSVHRQLVVLESGGVLIDTPGMRELQLWEPEQSLDETFADIQTLAAECRFRDCRHDREPGCAVKAAAESGSLDPGRYANYLKLQEEHAAFARKQQERSQIDAKRQRPRR
jgi:ribosome biogenesis GTPase